MATIRDVARQAGRSKTLVSRYLNGVKGVSPESREKIRAAIEALNYRPSGIARSLVSQKTHMLGIVVDDLRSPFLFRLIDGLERGGEDFDQAEKYNVVFCNSDGDAQRKRRHIQFLTQGRVDGIVIYGSFTQDDDLIRQLAASNFPFLLIENDLDGVAVNKIIIDNVGGARAATEYLIGLGHRRIAHIGGSPTLKITQDRLHGYRQALERHGLPVEPGLILFPDFSTRSTGQQVFFDKGYAEMHTLLARREPLPEAIFFATDLLAFGALKALDEAGRKVPEDISLVGFDDENPAFCNFNCPLITTVRQPLRSAGYFGIQRLIYSIEHPQAPKERMVLPTELIIRGSAQRRG